MFGAALVDPGSRRRPHRLPPDARRESVRVERQPVTAPDLPGRLRALRERGGRLVVVDPRRTQDRRGGRRAPRHPARRPTHCSSSRSCTCCFAEDLVDLGALARPRRRRRRRPRRAPRRSRPRRVADATGIDADTIRRIARELATRAGGRGVRAHRDVHAGVRHARVLARRRAERPHRQPRPAGRRDVREAGDRQRQHRRHARARAAACASGAATSRVRGLPEFFGELPVVCLAEEIETPGDGQIRALVTVAGNPVLSTPDSDRLDRALGSLDFMVSVDIYLNETTRHADVILPRRARARARPLRHRALQPRDPQRRELLAAGRRARAGRDGRSGRSCCGSRAILERSGRRTPTSTRSTTS